MRTRVSKRRRWAVASSLCAALCVAHCGDDAPVEPVAVTKGADKAAAKAAEAPAAPVGVPFNYSPVGKRDPFHSYLADMAEQGLSKPQSRKLEETEQYEMDQYRLTGVITGISQPKAMVEDPTGRGHVLRIGARLGKNGGRVVRVSTTGIVILEETRDPTGKRVRLPVTLKLPQTEFESLAK